MFLKEGKPDDGEERFEFGGIEGELGLVFEVLLFSARVMTASWLGGRGIV